MTKKDYILIATSIRKMVDLSENYTEWNILADLVSDLCTELEWDNSRFDWQKFGKLALGKKWDTVYPVFKCKDCGYIDCVCN